MLVVVDEEGDGIKHKLLCHIESLGVLIGLFDVIVLDAGVVLTETRERVP